MLCEERDFFIFIFSTFNICLKIFDLLHHIEFTFDRSYDMNGADHIIMTANIPQEFIPKITIIS